MAGGGGMGPHGLRAQRAPSLPRAERGALEHPVPVGATAPGAASEPAAGAGGRADPVRVSAAARVAPAGGLAGESQADLPAIHR
jgi:hypothetical protein